MLILVRLILAQILLASSFLKSFISSSIIAMICLLGSFLEKLEKLKPFQKRSVSIWVDCLEDMLITYFFVSVILLVVFVNFYHCSVDQILIYVFFVKSKVFLCKFWFIFSRRWSSSVVTNSKILSFNCLMLLLSSPCITWLICICSCNNSLPVLCNVALLCSVFILLFSCRSFYTILMQRQQRENRKWLVYDEYLVIVFSSFCILARMTSP